MRFDEIEATIFVLKKGRGEIVLPDFLLMIAVYIAAVFILVHSLLSRK